MAHTFKTLKRQSTRTKRSRTAAQAKQKRSARPGRSHKQQVWRIHRFAERFELKDSDRHCRRSGLLFTRDYVSEAGGDEALHYQNQFDMLNTGDGSIDCLLYGIYRKIVNISAKQSRAFRGYLLDINYEPLSDIQLARLLKFKPEIMSRYLKMFEDVQLLEKVDMPKFDLTKNEQPDDGDNPPNGGDKGQKKRSGKRSKRGQVAGKMRTDAGNVRTGAGMVRDGCGQNADCFKKENKNKNLNGNGKEKKEINKRQIRNTTANAQEGENLTGQGQTQEKAQTSTAETKPTKADVLGATHVIPFTQPPRRLNNSRTRPPANCQSIGDISRGLMHRYNPSAKQFGDEIYSALGLRYPDGSPEAAREKGSFASLWQRAEAMGISPPGLNQLKSRAITEARRITKYWRNRRGKPAAVWCKVFGDMIAKSTSGKNCKVAYRQCL